MRDTTTRLERLASSIATFSDTFAVKAHLAKMDAKDAWAKLQPVLDKQKVKAEKLATELKGLKDEAELQTYLGMKELVEKLDLATTHLEHMIETGKADVKTGLDMAKLKADLAAMDADDFMREKRNEIERAYASSKIELKTSLNSAFEKMSNRLENIIR